VFVYAFAAVEEIFRSHHAESDFDPAVLSHHFLGLVCFLPILERECALGPAPTRAEIRARVESIVGDFMKAFLKPR